MVVKIRANQGIWGSIQAQWLDIHQLCKSWNDYYANKYIPLWFNTVDESRNVWLNECCPGWMLSQENPTPSEKSIIQLQMMTMVWHYSGGANFEKVRIGLNNLIERNGMRNCGDALEGCVCAGIDTNVQSKLAKVGARRCNFSGKAIRSTETIKQALDGVDSLFTVRKKRNM
ncbi:hypothetical protein ACHAW6_008539 [Cyclotella cf. meneghiniana]